MKIFNWLKSIKRETLVKNSFLLPILLVVIMSISHVVSWYDLGNPISWAIYLSVAIEVFALSSVSAASMNINRSAVWFLFSLVTSIQIIGNIFFEFNDIDENGALFKSWIDLVKPFFDEWTSLDHRRLLAIIQGGTLPLMSLTALHYYIKFNDNQRASDSNTVNVDPVKPIVPVEPVITDIPVITEPEVEQITEEISPKNNSEPIVENTVEEEKKAEPDQIHISNNLGKSRKRLHPSKY